MLLVPTWSTMKPLTHLPGVKSWDGLTVCNNGDCSLPSENFIVEHTNCQSSVSVFSVDYDANLGLTSQVKQILNPLF